MKILEQIKKITQPNPFVPRKYGELQKISERVYIFRNITNSSFVVGDKSVALIDSQVNYPLAEIVLAHIRSVTDKPISHVINTHYHWDHTNGNALFKMTGAVIISSKLTKEFMVMRAPRQKEFLSSRGFELGEDPFLPEVTFEGEHQIDLGNMPLRLFFAGKAESDDATAIHVLSENILMSGDTVMTGSFPIFGQPVWDEGLQGDGEWEKTLENLMRLKPKHIIPGHGPLAHETDVELLLKIQKFFVEEVGKLVEKNFSLQEILANLEPRLPSWITKLPLVWGTPRYAILRVYRGLTRKPEDSEPGWQKIKPSAVPALEESMVNRTIKDKESEKDFIEMAHEAKEGGDVALVIAILEKASQIYSSSCDILALYADELIEASRQEASVLEKGDFFQVARRLWKKSLLLNPNHARSLLGLGRFLVMMAYRGGDDPAEGMRFLRKTIELNPENQIQVEAEFYLGMGYRRLGDEVKAKTQFSRALSKNPRFMPAILANQA